MLPPQGCAAGGMSSPSWAGCGAIEEAGGVSTAAAAAAAARMSSEAVGGAG